MKREAPIILKTPEDIEKLRKGNLIVAEILRILKKEVAPGITTMDLENIAEEELGKRKLKAAFKGYMGYPFCLCASVNEEIVHGMPSAKKVLREGDIVGLDFGVLCEGVLRGRRHNRRSGRDKRGGREAYRGYRKVP